MKYGSMSNLELHARLCEVDPFPPRPLMVVPLKMANLRQHFDVLFHVISDGETVRASYREKYGSMSNLELHAKLCKVDPDSGRRLHPNKRRKGES